MQVPDRWWDWPGELVVGEGEVTQFREAEVCVGRGPEMSSLLWMNALAFVAPVVATRDTLLPCLDMAPTHISSMCLGPMHSLLKFRIWDEASSGSVRVETATIAAV